MPSASPIAPTLGAAQLAQLVPAVQQAASVLPIVVNSVTAANGSLVANASLGQTNFQIPLSLSVPSGQTATSPTQILNLHLAPIHLNLLGLKVDTSEICLNITAQPGSGNLLGNLLGDVAHLLDNGLPLSQVLGSLTSTQTNQLTTGLTGLLNGALGQLTSPANLLSGATVTTTGTTRVLDLSVGPLNLNLLGLQVNLDNCHNGPVTVDITAQSGPGNLLGNLVGSLSHLLDGSAANAALINKLDKIAADILSLV